MTQENSRAGLDSHTRELELPRGARVVAEDVVALAKLTEASVGCDVSWALSFSDRVVRGEGVSSLEERLRGVPAPAKSLYCNGRTPDYGVCDVTLFIGSGSHLTISGTDLNLVAGTTERLRQAIAHRLSPPFWWRWNGAPFILFCMFLVGGLMAMSGSILDALVPRTRAANTLWDALSIGLLMGSTGILAFGARYFPLAYPRLSLRLEGEHGSAWFQDPRVEAMKTLAVLIGGVGGGLWGFLQVTQWLIRLLSSG